MKKTISFLLTLCMIVGLMPAAMAAKKATFKDVPENMWCFKYVEYVAEEGYFKGTTETTFEPNAPMTRQQFVVVLSRMVNAKVNNNQSPFTDVPAGSYSAGAIAWAAKHNIVQGYEDGTFHPTEPITRQQMAALMNRFMTYYSNNYGVRYISKNAKINFKDAADIGAYAKTAVDYCVKYGLILGYEDGTFRPAATATRAHVAAIIQRLDEVTRKGGGGGGSVAAYTITFQNATVGGLSSIAVSAGSTYTCVAPDAKDGYTFVKWNDGTNDYTVGQSFQVTGNVTLTAEWEVVSDPNDLLKTAFTSAVEYINTEIYSRYEAAQGEVNIDSVVVNELTTDFTGENREIYAAASAELNQATVNALIERAIEYAVALVKSTEPAADELTEDYQTVKELVIEVVEALGLTWTGKDIEAMAKEIYEQGKTAAYDVWDMYQANGEYIFETADVKVNGATIFSITAATKSTSLGAKASAKALAKAVAKDLYEDLKSNTAPTQEITLATVASMTFNGVPAVAQNYPTTYNLNVELTLKNDMLTYWYDGTAHNLEFTITQEMKDSYDAAMEAVAVEAMAVVEEVLTEKIDTLVGGFLSGASMDDLIDQLVGFGLCPDEAAANAAIEAVAADAANAWLAENLSTNETPANADYYLPYDFFWMQNGQIEISDGEYVLILGGQETERGLFNNAVLIDTIQAWADEMIRTVDIDAIMNNTMSDMLSDEVKAEYEDIIKTEAVAALETNSIIPLLYACEDANGQEHNIFEDMFLCESVDALKALSGTQVIASFDHAMSYETQIPAAVMLVDIIQQVIVDTVEPKVDDIFASVINGLSDQMVKDLINSSANIQNYVKYMAMVEMGFVSTYSDEYAAVTAAAQADIRTFLNDYVEDKINGTVNADDIADMIDAQIASIVGTYSQYLQYVPYVQSLNTFDELAAAKLTTVADALASDDLQKLIAKADIDSAKMNKAMNALAKAIEKLPADATVTINGVEFSEAAFAAIKAAAQNHDIAAVCDEVAELVYALGAVSLKNFHIPVEVSYAGRSEACILHIVGA